MDIQTALLAILVILGLYLLPILIIAFSDRTKGLEKLLWLVAVIFISWFAWILYAVFAPVTSSDP